MIVFIKVQRFELGGDPLAGIILEFSALMRYRYDTTLGAKDLFVVNFGSMGAVCTGSLDLFSEKHDISPRFVPSKQDYTTTGAGLLYLF